MECRYFAPGSDGPRISGLKAGPHIGRVDELNRFHGMTANALTEADYYPQVMSSRLGRGRGRITGNPSVTTCATSQKWADFAREIGTHMSAMATEIS